MYMSALSSPPVCLTRESQTHTVGAVGAQLPERLSCELTICSLRMAVGRKRTLTEGFGMFTKPPEIHLTYHVHSCSFEHVVRACESLRHAAWRGT